MDDYHLPQDDNSLRKCEGSVIAPCDISPEDEEASNCQQNYGRSDDLLLINSISENELTSHLASSGMAGIAAATAITSARSRNKPFVFETIPAVRKRQATRLMRKLTSLIDEYAVRVGQQIVVLVCNPKVAAKGTPHIDSPSSLNLFKVYGTSPLENVVRNIRNLIIQELDSSLRNYQVLHEQTAGSSTLWPVRGPDTLPPLMVDGIPTPLDKMTQAQLRAFIPVMLKYSTNRGKPGWGRTHARPPWWPEEVPWANVRSDVRTAEEKAQVSWTAVLKKIVRMCYEYHGREDLLHDYAPTGAGNNGGVNSTQMLDVDGHDAEQQTSYLLAPGSVNDVNESGRTNVYTMGLMHIPTSETLQNSTHYSTFAPQTYSFKTENDGSISIIPFDEHQKPPEVASMEAAAAIDEYSVDGVKFHGAESISMQGYSNTGDMVSLPAESMMQLDNDATATLYHIIANNSRLKNSRMPQVPEKSNRNHHNI
ncbi:DNA-binding protein P3A2 [Thelohanellus kitauei]|uniref:DNA-binding protein P3A2 n=1 Tax=Thelohanellus kitauei TaxID=669202 RepID=A0A0C2N3Z5_THEKT|nr:DNA-binding protein P3A2 [Thelohanellus kitauei]